MISGGASSNVIGGTEPEKRNLISGNDVDDGIGVFIHDTGTTKNVVEGNYIGTDPAGSDFLPNNVGVVIALGASGNVIGGTAPEARNVISGNLDDGVEISEHRHDGQPGGGQLHRHRPGRTRSLLACRTSVGVRIDSGASENVIGGTQAGAGNLISGNILAASPSPAPARPPTGSRATRSAPT